MDEPNVSTMAGNERFCPLGDQMCNHNCAWWVGDEHHGWCCMLDLRNAFTTIVELLRQMNQQLSDIHGSIQSG